MIKSQMTPAELDALPVTNNLPTAGRAFGLGRNKSYDLARRGEFPCRVIPVGDGRYCVPRSAIFEALGIEDTARERVPVAQ
jgi:hypothetical protein